MKSFLHKVSQFIVLSLLISMGAVAMESTQKARERLQERGESLGELGSKVATLKQRAIEFRDAAKAKAAKKEAGSSKTLERVEPACEKKLGELETSLLKLVRYKAACVQAPVPKEGFLQGIFSSVRKNREPVKLPPQTEQELYAHFVVLVQGSSLPQIALLYNSLEGKMDLDENDREMARTWLRLVSHELDALLVQGQILEIMDQMSGSGVQEARECINRNPEYPIKELVTKLKVIFEANAVTGFWHPVNTIYSYCSYSVETFKQLLALVDSIDTDATLLSFDDAKAKVLSAKKILDEVNSFLVVE